MNQIFRKLAVACANSMGSPWAFVIAFTIVLVWGVTGPMFHYSDTWQLVINTGTTIVTFLMVFLIQNTQNRDMKAVQLKLDELIRSTSEARNRLVDLEDAPDERLDELKQEFKHVKDRVHDVDRNVDEVQEDVEDVHHHIHEVHNRVAGAAQVPASNDRRR